MPVQPDLIEIAETIVYDYELTQTELECLSFVLVEELVENKRIVDVREKHSSVCGGDPNTSPKLFTIAIDENTGIIWSDARSATGQLEILDASAYQ